MRQKLIIHKLQVFKQIITIITNKIKGHRTTNTEEDNSIKDKTNHRIIKGDHRHRTKVIKIKPQPHLKHPREYNTYQIRMLRLLLLDNFQVKELKGLLHMRHH